MDVKDLKGPPKDKEIGRAIKDRSKFIARVFCSLILSALCLSGIKSMHC
jgi:hypothetical protein